MTSQTVIENPLFTKYILIKYDDYKSLTGGNSGDFKKPAIIETFIDVDGSNNVNKTKNVTKSKSKQILRTKKLSLLKMLVN